MRKRIILILALALLVAGTWWYVDSRQPGTTPLESLVDSAGDALLQMTQDGTDPPPLRAADESPVAHLTQAGVLKWTNLQRHGNGGLAPLDMNAQLNAAAEAKLQDLFAKQYFEHLSPTGAGPSDLAKQAGYDYAVVGENLALGNFEDDQVLVQAWMDSPGHRANILSVSYREIGIAVGQGIYEGHRTWIAVQEFGKPRSACPPVDAELKAKIEADEAAFKTLEEQAQRLKDEIDAAPKPHGKEERDAYNRKVDDYNAAIRQINVLNAQIQGEITVFNGQVQAYNACANS